MCCGILLIGLRWWVGVLWDTVDWFQMVGWCVVGSDFYVWFIII